MDSEKILFCYREDKLRKPYVFDCINDNRIVTAIPCQRKIGSRQYQVPIKKINKWIREIYQTHSMQTLWMDEALCRYLNMEKMDWPDSLIKGWLSKIPFFHTLILADNQSAVVLDVMDEITERLAALLVVCYENNLMHYEKKASDLYQREGIVLQIFTYEQLQKDREDFLNRLVLKGRVALLDFEDRRVFWEKRLKKDIGYYSFDAWNRLFLDTFRKNSYNTLTK